jgi:hypothetical protein
MNQVLSSRHWIRSTAVAVAVVWFGTAVASGGAASAPPHVELAAGAVWRFAAQPPATPEALERDWGQFELRLPVQGFVVSAPNCRDEIRLRWIALAPDAPGRAAKLQARWQLLEQLKALQSPDSTAAPLHIPLDLRYYTRRNKAGKVRLQYCNAFVNDLVQEAR